MAFEPKYSITDALAADYSRVKVRRMFRRGWIIARRNVKARGESGRSPTTEK